MTLATPSPSGPTRRTTVADAVARAAIVPITIEQYHRMVEQGIVPEDGSVELLHGVLVRKDRSGPGGDVMGHSPLHKLVVALLAGLAGRINSDQCHMQIQLPVSCPPDGEPEPDASIVRGTPRDFKDRIPGPGDVTCVIEAAHSSLDRDREEKLPIYARAAIPQYVLINLLNSTIEVYSDPDSVAGQYRTKATAEKSESILRQLPAATLAVEAGELLP